MTSERKLAFAEPYHPSPHMLYPQESESREVKDLSGIWSFRPDQTARGRAERWFAAPLAEAIPMPVPASYNDITQDIAIRDHLGDVWYERTFFIPSAWAARRTYLRFGSAEHTATVWVNGVEVAHHKGGFLPFGADIGAHVQFGRENRLTVCVNNVLSWDILPPGFLLTYNDTNHPEGYRAQDYNFDFFNYAGLNRPVVLVATPRAYIDDITLRAGVSGSSGTLDYAVEVKGGSRRVRIRVQDESGREVAAAIGARGLVGIESVQLWRPGKAYLYTFVAETLDEHGKVDDVYRETFGFRTIEVRAKQFLINGEPFYFQGCCKHEDLDVKGRGLDVAVNVKDFNLLHWMGANSFRTSHYPYSEEIMRLADRAGLVVIDEAPAVGMRGENGNKTFCAERISARTLAHHLQVMDELVRRDKNHPCVVMWSVANEPVVYEEEAGVYFQQVIAETRRLDPTRPVTLVTGDVCRPEQCFPFQYVDVMCINRYHSWYSDPGHLELIEMQVVNELTPWHEHFKKPLIVSEYGADTIAGFHADPPVMFSEEYQARLLENFHRGFDRLDFMIGEHVWNFADFATKQGITRVIGNRKGVFTRQRQPKAAAHRLRKRWTENERLAARNRSPSA
ncbi:MAG TPA: beta-glucuronidase [Opitutaceae bacterium]|nr:beta-glucuronidase [Opitutaceae bacterium]